MGDWTPRGSWSWPSGFWLRNLSPPSFDTNIKNSITPKFPGFMSYWATEIEGKSRMKNILGGRHFIQYYVYLFCCKTFDYFLFACYDYETLAQSPQTHWSCKASFKFASLCQGPRSTENCEAYLASQPLVRFRNLCAISLIFMQLYRNKIQILDNSAWYCPPDSHQ